MEHWVEMCRRGPQSLTLFKTETKLHAHFNTVLKRPNSDSLILIPYVSLTEIKTLVGENEESESRF